MKQRSPFVSVIVFFLELMGIFFVGWLLFAMIASAFAPQEIIDDSYEIIDRISIISAFAVALVAVLLINFNQVRVMREEAMSAYSNIDILAKRAATLLEKANKVADKYMTHEKDTQIGVSQARGAAVAGIKDASGFKAVIEAYPSLQANDSIIRLLEQIETCENHIANTKIRYNLLAQTYNSAIHTFPGLLVKGHAKDIEYYAEPQEEISDEELGI